MNQPSIRVLVADNHLLFRRGIRALLLRVPPIKIVEEASTESQLFHQLAAVSPDLILLDETLAGPQLEAVATIRAASPGTKIVLLVDDECKNQAQISANAGPVATLYRGVPPEQLIEFVRGLTSTPVTSSLDRMRTALEERRNSRPGWSATAHKGLTRREQEILALLMRGGRSRTIASQLGLSIKTVEAHKFNLMRKLDVHNRGELIKLVLRNQLQSWSNESALPGSTNFEMVLAEESEQELAFHDSGR